MRKIKLEYKTTRKTNKFIFYERILSSKDKEVVKNEINLLEPQGKLPKDIIRDPYVLEFLGLPDQHSFAEKDLENALIEHLQKFLLELGRGFSFVARQKRITFDGRHFYIDLLFYNYILKCFVIIDLKIGDLTHQDIVKGSYIRVAEADEPMSDYEIYSYDAYHRRVKDDIRTTDFKDFTILDDVLLEKFILNIKENKPEYPIKAVREAVLNALMHRDYSIHTEGAPVRIVMYSDRIEITNEGGLYGRITVDGLGKVHADTRNQTLTHILEVQKTAENRYSGIPTIYYEMKRMRLCKPEFTNRRGAFTVTLKNGVLNEYEQNDCAAEKMSTTDSLIDFCKTPRTRAELAEFLGKTQYYVMSKIVMPLVESGEMKMTLPDKPKSKDQKYYS